MNQDQAVRADVTLDGMTDLKPAFKPDGVITAGNSSPLNAGATSMLLMSKETAKKKGIRLTGTLARILNLKGSRYGCANACVGGGQGVATIIEREEYQW